MDRWACPNWQSTPNKPTLHCVATTCKCKLAVTDTGTLSILDDKTKRAGYDPYNSANGRRRV